jgi:hypothetical protein
LRARAFNTRLDDYSPKDNRCEANHNTSDQD